MQNISKKLIVVVVVVIIALVAGGLFWYASVKEKQSQIEQKGNENVTSSWRVYQNDEYGIEFKYPNESVVISQPSASKEYGVVFILSQNVYDDLQKNNTTFKENPLLGLIDKNEGIEVVWNRASTITNDVKTENVENSLKKFLGDSLEKTEQGISYQTSIINFQLMSNNFEKGIYKYTMEYKNTATNSINSHDGLIWQERDGSVVEMRPIANRKFGIDVENNVLQSALSFVLL